MSNNRDLQSHELDAFGTDEAFVILEGDELDDLLADEAQLRASYESAIAAHEQGIISDSALEKIKARVQLLLQRCHKVVTDIDVFVEKKTEEFKARKAAEEAKRRAEEEARRAEEEAKRREAAELQRQRQIAEERRIKEAEERKRLEEEAKARTRNSLA